MSDNILDAIDDLDDVEEGIVDDEPLDSEDDVLELDDYEMNKEEAQEITDAIRSSATATYILLSRAHEHKAWKSLGYATWVDYVKKEFEISPQRSYQLLDLSKTINEIEAVAPKGTKIKLTEAQARDIKRELPAITEQVKKETDGKDPDQASKIVDNIVDNIREQKKLDDEAIKKKDAKLEQAKQDGYHAGLEAAADSLLADDEKKKRQASNPDQLNNTSDSADDDMIDVEVNGNGDGLTAQQSMDLYNFFTLLSSLSSLPEPEEFIKTIPEDRKKEIDNQLLQGTAWLNRFQTLYEMKNS